MVDKVSILALALAVCMILESVGKLGNRIIIRVVASCYLTSLLPVANPESCSSRSIQLVVPGTDRMSSIHLNVPKEQ